MTRHRTRAVGARTWAAALVLAACAIAPPPATPADERPLPPPGEMKRCYALIRAERYAEARARLEPLVEVFPDWQRALFFLGLTYHEELRYAEARPLFERALALDDTSPDVPAIRLHYGWALYYGGRPDDARLQFEALLAVRPGYAEGLFALGLIDFDDDDVEGATRHLRAAIVAAAAADDDRTEGKARARLADVLVRSGELTAAREQLEAAVKLRPDAYEAWYKLSRVLDRLGDSQGAARALARHREVRERVRPTAESP